jgi:hypothetical protein
MCDAAAVSLDELAAVIEPMIVGFDGVRGRHGGNGSYEYE